MPKQFNESILDSSLIGHCLTKDGLGDPKSG